MPNYVIFLIIWSIGGFIFWLHAVEFCFRGYRWLLQGLAYSLLCGPLAFYVYCIIMLTITVLHVWRKIFRFLK